MTECTATISEVYYCKGNHQTGSVECIRQQREQQLIEIQEKEKVTIKKARQILKREGETVTEPSKKFPTHYN